MNADTRILEHEAQTFLSQDKYDEAYRLFRKAALAYRGEGNHKQSALCFASAASCWSKKSGEGIFYNAAHAYEQAAEQAIKNHDYDYASLLYKHAAVAHERDGEWLDFSKCFYRSKENYRRFLTRALIHPYQSSLGFDPGHKARPANGFRYLRSWFFLTFSYAIWGHGERPTRTFMAGIFIVTFCAFLYMTGHLNEVGKIIQPGFSQAFYFSMVTFTTVGYGDIVAVGATRLIAVVEAFSGLFIVPLFLVGLTRKYLRT